MIDMENKLKPYPFVHENNDKNREVYGQVLINEVENENGNEKKYILEISLLNNDMIAYDMSVLNGDEKKENIRPYFYEFISEPMDKRNILFWLFCFHRRVHPLFPENDPNIFKFKIYSDKEVIPSEDRTIKGKFLFGASPFRIDNNKGMLVIINGTDLRAVNSLVTNFKTTCRKRVLKKTPRFNSWLQATFLSTIDVPDRIIIDIYNVGQGNNIFINYGDKKIVFDMGLPNPLWELAETGSILKAKDILNGVEPDIVILSHWDFDHIAGVTLANYDLESKLWIAPNLFDVSDKKGKGMSLSAKRLASFLILKGAKLCLLDKSFDTSAIIQNTHYSLYKGTTGSSSINTHRITKANNYGLILSLQLEKSILLTGDCDYKRMPAALFQQPYDFLVVPHHGSEMSKPLLKRAPKNALAYISVGAGNSFGHPNTDHVAALEGLGYTKKLTQDLSYPDFNFHITL